MFAVRHAVFVGPGKLPDELRLVLSKRAGAPQPDIAIQVPRLLAIFESAAEAERIASQVQRLKIGVAVSGPEQPPAELSWAVARNFSVTEPRWKVDASTGDSFDFSPKDITSVTLLDWRPDEGAADRAVLLNLREQRPVMLRASLLDTVSRHSVPMDGLRRINEVLDAAALVMVPETRVRSRKLNEADFRGGAAELTGDLLPLVLSVVDSVDTAPGTLPQPLQGRVHAQQRPPPHHTDLTALCAWVLYLASLAGLVLSLAFFTVSVVAISIIAGVIGLALGAWGTRRFMWSRWLGQANWGDRTPIPSWPINSGEPGIQPRPFELGIDAITLFVVALGVMLGEGLLRSLSLWSLPFVLVAVLTSTVSVYEAWQRE
ncbi:MAG: hypothetical protein QM817_11105 [Archangium sp.]